MARRFFEDLVAVAETEPDLARKRDLLRRAVQQAPTAGVTAAQRKTLKQRIDRLTNPGDHQ